VPTGEGEDVIPSRRGMRISLRIWELALLATMVIYWKALVFRSIKMGRAYISPQTAPLIVPDQKVTSGALNVVV